MNFFGVSPNGQLIKIGDDVKTATWYYLTDKVKENAKGLKSGDEVTFQSAQVGGKRNLIFLAKGNVKAPPKPVEKTSTPDKPDQTKSYSKTEVSEQIKKLAIGNMTSRTLIALQGLVSLDNISTVIEKVYNKFEELVK